MSNKNLFKYAILLVATLPVFALAETNVTATANTSIKVDASARKLQNIIQHSDTAINARIEALNKLSLRIQAMKNVSAGVKASLASEVQTNTQGLSALKTKIDADTDANVAATDQKSIYGDFRIYALIIPKGYLLASADRVKVVSGLLTDLQSKLQARATTSSSAELTSLLADMTSKIADAKVEAGLAESGIVNLSPDKGDKAVAESNHSALVTARAHVKTASTDLKAAREDARKIMKKLKTN